jgi:uncharacterized protein (DUF305 family)
MCRYCVVGYFVLGTSILSGCSEKPSSREGEPGYSPTRAAVVVPPSTGDPDHDFLRRMSDHHKDLIRITHAVLESSSSAAADPVLRKFEDEHDHELDTLLALLRSKYNDSYLPKNDPQNDYVVEMMRGPQTDYVGIFVGAALKSEGAAVRLANDYLPKAKNPKVRAFAVRLLEDEQGEMASLRNALSRRLDTVNRRVGLDTLR